MQITCLNCSQTWQVSAEHLLAAKLKFALGFKEHTFVCPNCDARNVITEQEFRSHEQSDLQIPVTGTHRQTDTSTPRSHARQPGGSAPTNPVPSPDPISRQVHAVVLQRRIPLRREPSPNAEIVATLQKGEEVIILDTWTMGDNVWVQLGPERWAAVIENGEVLIELAEDSEDAKRSQ